MSFSEAIKTAERYGLSFLEVRTLGGSLDMPAYFAQNPPPAVHPEVRVLGTSFCLLREYDPDALKAHAALAQHLGTRYLRIFGEGGGTKNTINEEQLDTAAANLLCMRETLADFPVELILETHDSLDSGKLVNALNSRLAEPLKILWDSYNSWSTSGETLAETWALIGPLVVHVHYKDSVPDDSPARHHYVLPGEGTFPSAELRGILEGAGYTGGISLEWEKMWIPDLGPLEPALEKFVPLFR